MSAMKSWLLAINMAWSLCGVYIKVSTQWVYILVTIKASTQWVYILVTIKASIQWLYIILVSTSINQARISIVIGSLPVPLKERDWFLGYKLGFYSWVFAKVCVRLYIWIKSSLYSLKCFIQEHFLKPDTARVYTLWLQTPVLRKNKYTKRKGEGCW